MNQESLLLQFVDTDFEIKGVERLHDVLYSLSRLWNHAVLEHLPLY